MPKPRPEIPTEQFDTLSKDWHSEYCNNCGAKIIKLRKEGATGRTWSCPNVECYNHLFLPIEGWKEV